MQVDPVALAFAAWTEAHKRHIEGERRLAIAFRTAWHIGTTPPQELVDEVAALSAESDRLLRAADAAVNAVKLAAIRMVAATEMQMDESQRVLGRVLQGTLSAQYQSERSRHAISEARDAIQKSKGESH